MSNNNPKTLFRYRTISVNSLREISTSSFYASKPSAFNDPFDCDFCWKTQSKEDIQKYYTTDKFEFDEIESEIASLEVGIKDDVQNLGITCFTTDPLNPLMWAHYANGHRGVCIEYKREGVLDSEAFKKVKYDRDQKIIVNSVGFIENVEFFFDEVVYHKLKEWIYEKEWRLMLIQPTERLISLASPVESVTFGLRCPNAEITEVLNILKLHVMSGATSFFKVVLTNDGVMERVKMNVPVLE